MTWGVGLESRCSWRLDFTCSGNVYFSESSEGTLAVREDVNIDGVFAVDDCVCYRLGLEVGRRR